MISIRNRLVFMILGILFLGIALISLPTFRFVSEELAEIMDGNLRQLAISISPHARDFNTYGVSDQETLEEEGNFLIQIWEENTLLYTSHPRIAVPLQESGFGKILSGDKALRYFQRTYDKGIIQVAYSLSEREEMEHDILYHFIIPVFFLLPFLVGAVYIVIGQGLKPLLTISQRMRERGVHNLAPIDMVNIPHEIFPLIQSLNQLLRRLEESVALQRKFTADAAHELRTPLTAINLQLDMLRRAETQEERKEFENNLKSGLDRAVNLVQGLLMLARHETDALAMGMENVNLVTLVKNVIRNLEPLSVEKSQTVTFRHPKKAVKIEAQLHNIAVMIENLVQNAIFYTPDYSSIEVEVKIHKKEAVLLITDNGPGIKQEERLRVFDRFYRCKGTKQKGSGLGLSIVKNIVEYYHGTILIEDAPGGKGARFVVRFPVAQD